MGTKMSPLVIVAIVIAAIWLLPQFLGEREAIPPEDEEEEEALPVICDSTTTPSLDFLCRDIENTGTSVTCTVHYIVNSDGLIQTDADATNIALDANDEIEYYVNSTGSYGVHGTMKVPCKEEPRVSILMKDWNVLAETVQFFQEDDGLIISSSVSERVEIGDTPTIKFVYYGHNEDYLQDGLFFCEVDATYWDGVTLDGVEGTSSLIPTDFSAGATTCANPGGIAVNDRTYGAWALGDITSTPVTKYVRFDSDNTNDAGSTNLANVTCYIEDQDWYINEDDGLFSYGASDENDETVGKPAYATNITLYVGDT